MVKAKTQSLDAFAGIDDDFSEHEYLAANPDVRVAIESGQFESALHHYVLYGQTEGRATKRAAPSPAPQPAPVKEEIAGSRFTFENLTVSPGGGLFFAGWIDDAASKLVRIVFDFQDGSTVFIEEDHIARVRRGDVEAALGAVRAHCYGFWGFLATGFQLSAQALKVTLYQANGARQTINFNAGAIDDIQLRDTVLSHLAAANHFGNRHLEAIVSMGHWLGAEIIKFNRSISQRICASPYIEAMGRRDRKFKGSIVVCLYGKPEYLFLQNALFSGLPGIEDYEFIYVSNSPELAERLVSEARIATAVYGLTQTLVLLSGNAGFGAANNVAARYAHSDRLLIVNPDVFPRDSDWARKHTQVLESQPSERTDLFGVPLYYDDGSLMHGGMHFEVDSLPSVSVDSLSRHDLVRVEHYGKGAPEGTRSFRTARAVPAVTGAFMSVQRGLYERLEGFTEDFVFGHYEDADLCLKALMSGTNTWLHDIGLWHLEGKGSTRLPVHEGGSLVNRWLFTTKWGALIKERLNGPSVDLSRFARSSANTAASEDDGEGEQELLELPPLELDEEAIRPRKRAENVKASA